MSGSSEIYKIVADSVGAHAVRSLGIRLQRTMNERPAEQDTRHGGPEQLPREVRIDDRLPRGFGFRTETLLPLNDGGDGCHTTMKKSYVNLLAKTHISHRNIQRIGFLLLHRRSAHLNSGVHLHERRFEGT